MHRRLALHEMRPVSRLYRLQKLKVWKIGQKIVHRMKIFSSKIKRVPNVRNEWPCKSPNTNRVRPMLLVRCLSVCLSVLSVTLVHCGQTVGRIKMKLGVQVGLGPGHIVLDGHPAPLLQRGTAPNFRPISVEAKWLHGSRCHLVWR